MAKTMRDLVLRARVRRGKRGLFRVCDRHHSVSPAALACLVVGMLSITESVLAQTTALVSNNFQFSRVWDDPIIRWVPGNANGYAEGESAPISLNLIGLTEGTTYGTLICLDHDRSSNGAIAFTGLSPVEADYIPVCADDTATGGCSAAPPWATVPWTPYATAPFENAVYGAARYADGTLVPMTISNVAQFAEGGGPAGSSITCPVDFLAFGIDFTVPDDPNGVTQNVWVVFGAKLAAPGQEYDTDGDGSLDAEVQPVNGDGDLGGASNVGGTFQIQFEPAQRTINFQPGAIVTFASVSSFAVYPDAASDTVAEWSTDMEIGTIGFHLERLVDPFSGRYERLTEELLPSAPYSPHGSTYRFVDESAWPGDTYTYRLVEVEASGRENRSGPYMVDVPEFNGAAPVALAQTSAGVPVAGDPSTLTGFQAGRVVNDAQQAFTTSRFEREERGPSAADRNRFAAAAAFADDKASVQAQPLGAATTKTAIALQAAAQQGATPAALKVFVREAGMHVISATAMAEALRVNVGQVRWWIWRNNLSLECPAGSVATQAAPGNDALVFYHDDFDNAYTNEAVCWLTLGRGERMGWENGRRPRAVLGQTFLDTVIAEADVYPVVAVADTSQATGVGYHIMTANDDFWYWQPLFGAVSEPFEIRADGTSATGEASLKVELLGYSDTNHEVTISLNGEDIGTLAWSGDNAFEGKLTFGQSKLVDGINMVTVSNANGDSNLWVGGFALSYKRAYMAVDDALVVEADGNAVITIDNFSTNQVSVYNITNPRQPKRVWRARIERSGTAYRVSFRAAAPDARYLAVTDDGSIELSGDQLEPAFDTSYLRSSEAEVVIIAPAKWKGAAQGLADIAEGQGYITLLASLEEVQDEFAAGMRTPEAVRDFLAYAHANWALELKYAVLVGAGKYDYKGLLGPDGVPDTSDDGQILNPMPPMMVQTPYGWYACDLMCLGDPDQNGEIDIGVGRIPALTPDEVVVFVDKLQGFLNGPEDVVAALDGTADWTTRVILAADDKDGYDFKDDSDLFGDRVPQPPYSLVHLNTSSGASAADLKGEIDSGAMVANYIGHGGPTNLMGGPFNGGGNTNGDKLPLFSALSCAVGRFEMPNVTSMAERLVMSTGGGAHTAFTSNGLSINEEAVKIGEGLFEAIFEDGQSIVGDAVVQALQTYLDGDDPVPFMPYIYNLIGYPATEMPLSP